MTKRLVLALGAAFAVAALAAAAGLASSSGSTLRGNITADGSSTVGPYTTTAAEMFKKIHSRVNVTVGISGTGGGFERFCRGEIDLANASRGIRATESKRCADNGIGWIAFTVANDGIAIVVNKSNTWATCLTTQQLNEMWKPGSRVNNWRDLNPSWPDQSLKLFGPGTDSGTFDFFTEAINGRARSSRTDFFPSENDNVIVQGVSGERGGLGYFGLSYYTENKSRLNLVKVNSGTGCVAPTAKTVQSRRYKPLSRPLFIYVKRTSFVKAPVKAFIGFILKKEREIARRARFVPLTDAQLALSRAKFKGKRR
jgi:phosphate transport system substrate-binding protein